MKYYCIPLLIMCIAISSCKKKSDGNSVDPFMCRYFPLSEGSLWVYNGKTNGVDVTITHTSSNVSSNGTSVSATYTRGGNPAEHVVCSNGEVTGTTTNAITGTISLAFLRENAAKDSIWYFNFVVQSIPARVEIKVVNRGHSVAVNGTTYNDVLEMSQKLFLDLGTGFALVESSVTTYAPNVGIVQSVNDSLTYGHLVSYNIVQ